MVSHDWNALFALIRLTACCHLASQKGTREHITPLFDGSELSLPYWEVLQVPLNAGDTRSISDRIVMVVGVRDGILRLQNTGVERKPHPTRARPRPSPGPSRVRPGTICPCSTVVEPTP